MRATIHLGRVAGVRIGLHWSVLGIMLLIALGVAGYQLPTAFPGRSPVVYVAGGVAAAVLLVLSLLGHELAHAVVARRNGIAVEDITLWLLGGVARLRGEARRPAIELRVAIVGPAASAVLAVLFGGATWATDRLGADPLVVAVLGYIAVLNLVLAVFNLVPAAPLDGGRVLRAALWAWRGDRFTAAVWSARAGRGFGILLAVLGVVSLLDGSASGLWWVLLGWFVMNVAMAEEEQARVGVSLAGVTVRDVMTSPVDTAAGSRSVESFLHGTALDRRHSAFPLVDDTGRLTGLVTLSRLRAVPGPERETTSVGEIACPVDRVPTAERDEPLALVLPRLAGSAEGRILVLDGERPAGIVSPSDISRVVAERGLSITVPGAEDRPRLAGRPQPPSGWWFPGQRRST
jgi:Zn-dependent protease/predicted transcriptional regulator